MSRPFAALLVLLSLLLAGCGGGDAGGGGADAGAASGDGGGSAFPVTVEHRFGETTVPREPQRVVVVGLTEQDTLYELGVKPVGVTEWYGDQPYATWPWATQARGDSKPTVLEQTDGIEYEKVAELRPDLIIGTNAGLDKRAYARLSKLAPTVASVKNGTDYFSPWDDQVKLVAAAVGKADEGEQLVADTEAAYAKVAAEHPDFEGKTVTFSQNAFYDGRLYAYPAGLNTEFLTMLGFRINPRLAPLAEPGMQAAVSAERLDVIDTDALLFATEKASDVRNLYKVPTFGQLDAVRNDRAVFTDATLSGAMYFMTPLSLRYVLDRLPDLMQTALDGESPRRMVYTNR